MRQFEQFDDRVALERFVQAVMLVQWLAAGCIHLTEVSIGLRPRTWQRKWHCVRWSVEESPFAFLKDQIENGRVFQWAVIADTFL